MLVRAFGRPGLAVEVERGLREISRRVFLVRTDDFPFDPAVPVPEDGKARHDGDEVAVGREPIQPAGILGTLGGVEALRLCQVAPVVAPDYGPDGAVERRVRVAVRQERGQPVEDGQARAEHVP